MRWVAIGLSLSALVTLLGGVSDLVLFIRDPISIMYAFLSFVQAPLTIFGSCLSIAIFLKPMSKSSVVRKWGSVSHNSDFIAL